jgi:hypothetical protein
MSNTMLSPEALDTWSSPQSTTDRSGYPTGPVVAYEESGMWSRRAHSHNGYSSGFSPSRSQWREPDARARTSGAA